MHTSLDNNTALPCESGVEALGRAIGQQLPESVDADDDHWRACARLMCLDARDRGVRVEQLLISLKRIWPTLPGIERMPRDARVRLLSRIVTLCVEEYYAPFG